MAGVYQLLSQKNTALITKAVFFIQDTLLFFGGDGGIDQLAPVFDCLRAAGDELTVEEEGRRAGDIEVAAFTKVGLDGGIGFAAGEVLFVTRHIQTDSLRVLAEFIVLVIAGDTATGISPVQVVLLGIQNLVHLPEFALAGGSFGGPGGSKGIRVNRGQWEVTVLELDLILVLFNHLGRHWLRLETSGALEIAIFDKLDAGAGAAFDIVSGARGRAARAIVSIFTVLDEDGSTDHDHDDRDDCPKLFAHAFKYTMSAMISLIFGTFLLILLLLAVSAQKTYSYVPLKELKRQARRGDELAKVLYSAAAYGVSLRLLLWTVILLSAAGSFVLLQMALPDWFMFILLVVILWLSFMWLPSSRLTGYGARIVAAVTPAIRAIVRFAQPVLDKLTTFAAKYRPVTVHTGLYEREDIISLLDDQAAQPDSRIDPADLTLARQVMTFGDKQVRDCLTPRRVIRSVKQVDAIGPVLMGELHESGHSRFPVHDEQDDIVGILYLRDLVSAMAGGQVKAKMRADVYYVHEDHSLRQVLDAFLKTKQHLFIVVNEFEEYVGLITIEDVLEQILGQPIVDEFDKYDDLRAVAKQKAASEHAARAKHEPVVELPDETPAS